MSLAALSAMRSMAGCIRRFCCIQSRPIAAMPLIPTCKTSPSMIKRLSDICRRALTPSPGHQLVKVDFRGIKVAIAATYHKDPTMLTYLNDLSSDMHGDMAEGCFCCRASTRPIRRSTAVHGQAGR